MILNLYGDKPFAYEFNLWVYNNDTNSFLYNSIIDSLNYYIILEDEIVENPDVYLFLASISDKHINNEISIKSFFSNSWFNNIVFEKKGVNLAYSFFDLESLFFLKSSNNFLLTNSYAACLDYTSIEDNISLSLQIVDLLLLSFFVGSLLIIYVTYYNSPSVENNTIDSDYLSSSLLIESEKEIASLDDLILAALIVSYIFGCFFYISAWNIMGSYPELMLMVYLIPFLIYLVFGMPSVLLIDFGNYFLMFIRGCGSYNLLSAELMYDYINSGAFYVRLSVQWVRLFIMFLTFIIMHDTISFCIIPNTLFIGFIDYIWENFSDVTVTFSTLTYFSLTSLIVPVLRLLFELVHTLFVCTAQFVAFFAISFWFFFFLYSFFSLHKFENYFLLKKLTFK